MQQAVAQKSMPTPWWPKPTTKPSRRTTPAPRADLLGEASTDFLRNLFETQATPANDGPAAEDNHSHDRPTKDWMDVVARNAFWQAVDAIRAHKTWTPAPQAPSLFGDVTRDIDRKLVTELAWIFAAEDERAPLPFELAADAVGIDQARFRRICQRAFPEECAWLEAHVGPLQGV